MTSNEEGFEPKRRESVHFWSAKKKSPARTCEDSNTDREDGNEDCRQRCKDWALIEAKLVLCRLDGGDESVANVCERHSHQKRHEHRNSVLSDHEVVVVCDHDEDVDNNAHREHGEGVVYDEAFLLVL